MKKNAERLYENVEIRGYSSHFGLGLKLRRLLWNLVWLILFRPSPFLFYGWRRLLLRLFGAEIGPEVHVYPSAKVWAPWNLTMGEGSSLGPSVDCYCVDKVELGPWAIVSQRSFLCTATHEIRSPKFELKTEPIKIGEKAWVAAEAFVAPGVKVGNGAVIAARAVVIHDVKPWTVVAGNPAQEVSKRIVLNKKSDSFGDKI